MQFENTIKNEDKISNEQIKVKELFENYLFYWKWFLFGLLMAILLAFLFLRYAEKTYYTSATIFIDDKETGGLSSELAAFEDMGTMSTNSANKSVTNEIGVLKSRTIIESVVKKLKLNVIYRTKGRIRHPEIYGSEVPFRINFFVDDSVFHKMDTIFHVIPRSDSNFVLVDKGGVVSQELVFGKNTSWGSGEINITPTNVQDIRIGEVLIVEILPLKIVSKYYRENINVVNEGVLSSLLKISLIDTTPEKAKDILNQLISNYNSDAIAYKTKIAESTDNFINERIKDISIDLNDIDRGVEDFKFRNKLTDIETESGINLTSSSELQDNILDLNSQIRLVEYISSHIQNNPKSLIPSNLGLRDERTNESSTIYNSLLLERNRIIKGSSELNPTVINLDEQLEVLRRSIEQSLETMKISLNFSLTQARNRQYQLNEKREAAPQQEREFQNIKRKQQIIESLYLYLLEKREENAIALGIPVPNAKIVDTADSNKSPIFPQPIIIFIVAIIAGIMVPLISISIKAIFDTKVHNSEDIESRSSIPVIGVIPNSGTKKKIVVESNNNNQIAESFRLLRTNVDFMLGNKNDGPKTIFITSTIATEGKTFITLNLASAMALLNKKVLVIGSDIRKPKIDKYLEVESEYGLSELLVNKELAYSRAINSHEKYKFDFISSGVIPPNPSELLLNGRFDEILSFSKQNYDYVIVDTSPVNLVTDTLLLGKSADLFIYVVRAEHLDKRLLKIPQRLFENKRLPNMSILINDVKMDKQNYGYGYGYGYGDNVDS